MWLHSLTYFDHEKECCAENDAQKNLTRLAEKNGKVAMSSGGVKGRN